MTNIRVHFMLCLSLAVFGIGSGMFVAGALADQEVPAKQAGQDPEKEAASDGTELDLLMSKAMSGDPDSQLTLARLPHPCSARYAHLSPKARKRG